MSLVLSRWDHLDLVLQIDCCGCKERSCQFIYAGNSVITNINEFFQTHTYGHLYGSSG